MVPLLLSACVSVGSGNPPGRARGRAEDDDCTLRVPEDQPYPQAAIEAAIDGDRVCVGGGIWPGLINLMGKDVELIGVDGAAATTLDADGGWGPVVTMDTPADANPLLQGFTITNGTYGYGVYSHPATWTQPLRTPTSGTSTSLQGRC